MANERFEVCNSYEQRPNTMYLPNYEYWFNDKEPVLTWPYHSQFVTEFCTFMVFDDVLTGYWIFLFKKFQKYIFVTSSIKNFFAWDLGHIKYFH